MNMKEQGLPVGLGMALAMNGEAMKRFASMTEAEQEELIRKARMVRSKSDMTQLVSTIAGRTEG